MKKISDCRKAAEYGNTHALQPIDLDVMPKINIGMYYWKILDYNIEGNRGVVRDSVMSFSSSAIIE